MEPYERLLVDVLRKRLGEKNPLIQIVVGPRQVGKTTALTQVLKKWKGASHYQSADLPLPPETSWVETQWAIARSLPKKGRGPTLLVLDEVQKVHRWGEVVKALFDEDRRTRTPIRVVLLGSSSLQVQKGANESLSGRFELHYCSHWTYPECRKAFKWNLEKWIYYGGYPGARTFLKNHDRWAGYIGDSIIEPAISKDILQLTPVVKPALLRRLFSLAVHYPGRIFSFNKMLGQLQDAGNTVTIAHYLELLKGAFLVSGIERWSGSFVRTKSSSPKLIIWNDALITALSNLNFSQAKKDREFWGWLVENAVGAAILNQKRVGLDVFYWRHRDREIDYVLQQGKEKLLIEVKSSRRRPPAAFGEFQREYGKARSLIVGPGGVQWEDFFSSSIEDWF